jgi:hypothetical protein
MKKISALLLALVTAMSFGFDQHAFAKSSKSAASSDTIQVAGYTKKDGTVVKGYTRKKSTKSADASKETKSAKTVETPAATEKTETTKVDTKDSAKPSKGKHSK